MRPYYLVFAIGRKQYCISDAREVRGTYFERKFEDSELCVVSQCVCGAWSAVEDFFLVARYYFNSLGK